MKITLNLTDFLPTKQSRVIENLKLEDLPTTIYYAVIKANEVVVEVAGQRKILKSEKYPEVVGQVVEFD